MLPRLFRKVRPRSVYDVFAVLAFFIAVGTGGAYAANTIGSTDIIDGQVKSVDVGDNEIKSSDVKDESLTTFDVSTFLGSDVVDGTLTGADIQDSTIGGFDIADGAIGGFDIADGAVGSADIGNGAIGGVDIANGTLTAQDVGENAFLDFAATIPTLFGNDCATIAITGVAGQFDHMLLTPSSADANPKLTYQIEYNPGDNNAKMVICDPVGYEPSQVTHFNLLVFQH
jgi:hypothetical protein